MNQAPPTHSGMGNRRSVTTLALTIIVSASMLFVVATILSLIAMVSVVHRLGPEPVQPD